MSVCVSIRMCDNFAGFKCLTVRMVYKEFVPVEDDTGVRTLLPVCAYQIAFVVHPKDGAVGRDDLRVSKKNC